MKIHELAQRLGVPYREVRYVLEQGHVPPGADKDPGRGEHREFSPGQVYWLAILLLLRTACGMRTPFAAEVTENIRRGLDQLSFFVGEDSFNPFRGKLDTRRDWAIEIGDGKHMRPGSRTSPGSTWDWLPWTNLEWSMQSKNYLPLVTVRIDLREVARRLG